MQGCSLLVADRFYLPCGKRSAWGCFVASKECRAVRCLSLIGRGAVPCEGFFAASHRTRLEDKGLLGWKTLGAEVV